MCPSDPELASVIGDIVSSRESPSRRGLHERVRTVLAEVNHELDHNQPMSPTVGDEFQGVYNDLATAIHSTMLIRLRLIGIAHVRFGIGWGPLNVFRRTNLPFEQDGPAWWAAREAIEAVARAEKRRDGPRGLRTACIISDRSLTRQTESHLPMWQLQLLPLDPAGPGIGWGVQSFVNAFLICRDAMLARMDDRDARITLALLRGRKQAEIAESEGISPSAVAQRLSRNDAHTVVHSSESLSEGFMWNQ